MSFNGKGIYLILTREPTWNRIIYINDVDKGYGSCGFRKTIHTALDAPLVTGIHESYLSFKYLIIPEEFLRGIK